MAKSKKQLAQEIMDSKTAAQMIAFLEGRNIEQAGLEQAFYDFLGEMHVVYFLDWNIIQEDERRQAAQYLAKFMGKFIEWTNGK